METWEWNPARIVQTHAATYVLLLHISVEPQVEVDDCNSKAVRVTPWTPVRSGNHKLLHVETIGGNFIADFDRAHTHTHTHVPLAHDNHVFPSHICTALEFWVYGQLQGSSCYRGTPLPWSRSQQSGPDTSWQGDTRSRQRRGRHRLFGWVCSLLLHWGDQIN